MTIAAEHPELTGWWREMDTRYGNTISEGVRDKSAIRLPVRFFREHMAIDDIIDMTRLPFERARDDHMQFQLPLPYTFNEELDDQELKCAESCEAF